MFGGQLLVQLPVLWLGVGCRWHYSVVAAKPWYRQWFGAPEWLRENPTAKDPDGQTWDLEARPVGVPKITVGQMLPLWAIGWVVHALKYRHQWEIDVRLLEPANLIRRFGPKRWIYEGYGSKAEARAAIPRLAKQIEDGDWRPRSGGSGNLAICDQRSSR
jgi:hypothetical protein